MINKELRVKVDPGINFSVNTQIKEQLKWLIGLGVIEPGDMLPSANQMADILGLNRNTVNLVYTQLRDEGMFTMQKGRGTQVMNGSKVELLQNARQPMHQLVAKTIEEAEAQGIPLIDFFIAGLAYTLLRPSETAARPRILLIECRGHDHLFYRQEIERVTKAEVHTLFVEDLMAAEGTMIEVLEHADVIVTTLNHAEEVKTRYSRYEKKLVVIGATIEMSALLGIAQMKPDSEVAFVCLGRAGGQWMASGVRDAGITQIHPHMVGIDEQEQLHQVIDKADKVYASPAVYKELLAMNPDKVALYPMTLEKSSERLLRDISENQDN
ncbi:GntR family transcriptional regulator [Paenibacillus guangzhouensis]|uniref:GntR family transcriptional regulator n=1 Tax=Paenibacillus guangzhouensis TaxID=1473112 RepID=UPI00187BB4EF|nr:GntR family transcriptional regulator [Paenibacillus guangzhouensis]